MLDLIMPPVLSGGTRRVRPERRILSIASFAAASRSLSVCPRRAARQGTSAPIALSVESCSLADGGPGCGNGSRRRDNEYHPALRGRGGTSRGDIAKGENEGEGFDSVTVAGFGVAVVGCVEPVSSGGGLVFSARGADSRKARADGVGSATDGAATIGGSWRGVTNATLSVARFRARGTPETNDDLGWRMVCDTAANEP